MEKQTATRRLDIIAAHFAPSDDISGNHVFPMNCSASLNYATQRCDNRMYFARQGSDYSAPFMRKASIEEILSTPQNSSCSFNSVAQRRDNRVWFARQGSDYCGPFMRQSSNGEFGVPHKDSDSSTEASFNTSQEPLFSRLASTGSNIPDVGAVQPVAQVFTIAAPEPPMFARPSWGISEQKQLTSKKNLHSYESKSIEWSPRMDVAESGRSYVLTVEIPGVTISDIRVEVDDQKLTVTGQRSNQFFKVAGNSSGSISTYLKREILQGPYQVVWPLPANVNKDNVSAEFWDGFLQIVIPKV